MRAFTCPACHEFIEFEDLDCPHCAVVLGFEPGSSTFWVVTENRALIDDEDWYPCAERSWGCNWLVRHDEGSADCVCDQLVRRRPDIDDTIAMERLAATTKALRMLIHQLIELNLPLLPWTQYEGGLCFDLVSSESLGEPVMIGHASGVITIDLAESLDDQRERLRVQLGEPYRTMLGHFRHEVGHYFEMLLFQTAPGRVPELRELFGDDTASYGDALDRHYTFGAPETWQENFISEYATMHPYEDFAECFAHYLHITETLDTANWAGLELGSDSSSDGWNETTVPPPLSELPDFRSVLKAWRRVSQLLNRMNRSMGKDNLYPFVVNEAVTQKLAFIHDIVRATNAWLNPAILIPDVPTIDVSYQQ